MTDSPVFSIVTPTMNRAALLRRTIDSVRSQRLTSYEHIVVDGGSHDGTTDLLFSLEGSYPLRWISEPDTGMYNAINKGLAMARGEVIAYLNSDDLYFPWTLETVARVLRKRPEVDFVYGDALSVDDETGARRLYWQFPFHADTIRRSAFLAQPTVFWRRRAFEALGPFDESLRYVADCDFWMRAAAAHRFHKVNEVLAVERDHAETLRSTGTTALDLELDRVRRRYVELDGLHHRVAHARNIRREQVLERLSYVAFAVQATLPRRLRLRWWRRFLSSDDPSVNLGAVVQLLLPSRAGARETVLNPSRRWLEPVPPA